MILPDVNVLIYAFRNDAEFHDICRPWLEGVIASGDEFGMSDIALSAVVRITTQTRQFEEAATVEKALAFCDYILVQPNCRLVRPRDRHWDIFKRVLAESGIRGRKVTDAWFAALAIEWNCEWVTMDRDFARFPGLRWSMPTASA